MLFYIQRHKNTYQTLNLLNEGPVDYLFQVTKLCRWQKQEFGSLADLKKNKPIKNCDIFEFSKENYDYVTKILKEHNLKYWLI